MTIAPHLPPGLRESQEFQSALVRFLIGAAALVFLFVGHFGGYLEISWGAVGVLYCAHLLIFLGILLWILARPRFIRLRSEFSIVADLSAITSLIYLSGDALSPLFLIYVVLYISQGTRHGRRNLTIAALGSVVSFAFVVTLMQGWAEHPVQLGFVLAALGVLPVYQDALLRNLQRQRERAEAANTARGEFLATMSHELRTPLSGMVGTARLLQNTELDSEQRRCVEGLCHSGETLQALIGDILDLSKVDAGSLELHDDHFDLRQSLLDVCRNLGQQALDKRVELVCCIDGALPECVRGDRVRFEQILYNLIGNAVKFTPAGRVCVEAERAAPHRDLRCEHLEIVIGDTGIGIPRDRLDCIFDSFWQADTRSSRHHGGTGLGTTIAHRLTRAMGGHIVADSEEDQGTTFRVRLPFLPEEGLDRPLRPPPGLAGRTVLVQENDPEARSALEEACRFAGMRVVSASDDAELERQLATPAAGTGFDIALVADTPEGIDLEAAGQRVRDRLQPGVALLYVGYGGRLALRGGDRVPAVAKPWHPAELWGAMARALAAGPQSARAATGEAAARSTAAGNAAHRVLVIEDDAVNAEIVATLLRRSGHDVVVAPDGASGLARIDEHDFDLVLVDLRMPGMDGIEFARRARGRERDERRLPIVALTASADAHLRNEGLSAGMDALLTKPVDAERLDSLLRELAPA